MTDDKGIDQIGGAASYCTFVEEHYSTVLAAVSAHVGDAHLAQDVTQEAFLRAGVHWRSLVAHPAPRAWVLRVAYNVAASRFRRTLAARRAHTKWFLRSRPVEYDEIAVDELDPNLVAALAALPVRQRQAVILRHVVGMDVGEVCEVLQASDQAVRTLTSRGLATLRARLGGSRPM